MVGCKTEQHIVIGTYRVQHLKGKQNKMKFWRKKMNDTQMEKDQL